MHPYRHHPHYFYLNDTGRREYHTLSLHDALPIFAMTLLGVGIGFAFASMANLTVEAVDPSETGMATGINTITRTAGRSEEHTSELQSQFQLVCRLLLEKKKSYHPNKV